MTHPVDGPEPAPGPDEVVRRAPFSDNPRVGARGQRTQQRILDAAIGAFAQVGYHRCGVDRITTLAGCSRASFYQYFSSKEDVFRHLTGQVARQLDASTEALETITPDADGWHALRSWIGRDGDTYRRYEPVFHAFVAESDIDPEVAEGSRRWQQRSVQRIAARVDGSDLSTRQLDAVIGLLLDTITRTHDMARTLRVEVPSHYGDRRVDDALADVAHRCFHGLDPDVNVHPSTDPSPPALRFDPVMRDTIERAGAAPELTPAGRQTLAALMSAGHDVFVERGYHRTRVDDVVEAAGVSHGAFYRYFSSKDELARLLTTRATAEVSAVLADMPTGDATASGRTALRQWLRRYNETQVGQAAMLRVWMDAAAQDTTLRSNSAPALDWGRRTMLDLLGPRAVGDVEIAALIAVALLSSFGARPRTRSEVDAAAHMIDTGFRALDP